MRAAQFLAIIGRGSKGSNALENTEDRAGATSEQQDNVINTVNSLDPYGPSWQLVPGNVAAGTVYAQVPTNGTGDLAFTRASTATRTNSAGTIVDVATGVPRIHYRNADGSLSSTGRLLLEPQRTNLATFSEQFDNAAWTKQEVTISANAGIAPDGTLTADKAIPSTVSTTHQITSGALVTSQTCSFGIFAKADGYNTIEILDRASAANGAIFNLTNGTFTIRGTATAIITDAGNGWYRCTVIVTTTGVRYYIPTSASAFAGNGTSGVLIWGAQLEAGAYPTTYIPTTTAAVTRLADSPIKTGVSSLIGQTEGTLFAEIDLANWASGNRILALSDQTSSNSIVLQTGVSANTLRLISRQAGNLNVTISSSTISGTRFKLAAAYANDDFVFYVNGTQIGTDNSATVPACNFIAVGKIETTGNSNELSGSIAQAALFTRRLTNAELAAITTL